MATERVVALDYGTPTERAYAAHLRIPEPHLRGLCTLWNVRQGTETFIVVQGAGWECALKIGKVRCVWLSDNELALFGPNDYELHLLPEAGDGQA